MRSLLEILRVGLIIFFASALMGGFLKYIYGKIGVAEEAGKFGLIAVLILIYIFYQNRWQFSSWNDGDDRKKLSRRTTIVLSVIALFFLIIPLFFS